MQWIFADFSTPAGRELENRTDSQSISLRDMDQVFPSPVENIDPVDVYAADDRASRNGRPWVFVNMISSIDGGVALDGLSGGLGGPGDKAVFSALRGVADVIVAASGTVIAENYRRPQTPGRIQDMRAARGQARFPQLAIVTNSASIDPAHRVFDPGAPPLLITHTSANPNRVKALSAVAEVVRVGDGAVDLAALLDELGRRGARTVLVEGGPTLNAAFVAADLVDELCLSVSPMIVGGSGPRVVGANDMSMAHAMRLDRVLHDEGFLFHRYVRDRAE